MRGIQPYLFLAQKVLADSNNFYCGLRAGLEPATHVLKYV